MTEREALKLALELERLGDRFSEGWHEGIKIDASDIMLLTDVAAALRERLAQPDPVIDKSAAIRIATALGWTPKPTPLTYEEIMEIHDPFMGKIEFARAIEAKHQIFEDKK